ncbi:hypothetical protein JKP88DRAFT_172997, partial [Tribonema minus]
EWSQLRTCGKVPSSLSGQGAAVVDERVYMFGGCDGEVALNDVHCFDVQTNKWCAIVCQEGPSPRAAFGMCSGPGEYAFTVACGCGIEQMSALGDMWSFDVRHHTWSKLFESPQAMYGVPICWYDGTLLLHGGTMGVHYSDALYAFNLDTGTVAPVVTSGNGPSKRYKHESFIVGEDMFVCGGGAFAPTERRMDMYRLNLSSLVWRCVKVKMHYPF